MKTLFCSCGTSVSISEFVSPSAIYTCKDCNPKAPDDVRLQDCAFEPGLNRRYYYPPEAQEVFQKIAKTGKSVGYQIHKDEDYAGTVPEWANNFDEIRKLLLKAFPKCKSDLKQFHSAQRWLGAIYYCYRLRYTTVQAAEAMYMYGVTPKAVERILQRANEVYHRQPNKRGRRKSDNSNHSKQAA